MAISEHDSWLANLKAGDPVGIYEFRGGRMLHQDTVVRRTPSGRIVTERGNTYNAEGYLLGKPGYSDRHLKPVSQEG